MPGNMTGKRWVWNHRKCECRRCKVCRHREAAKKYYHNKLSVAARKRQNV